jgi:hypothetical protein
MPAGQRGLPPQTRTHRTRTTRQTRLHRPTATGSPLWPPAISPTAWGRNTQPYTGAHGPLMGVYRLVVAGWFLSCWSVSTPAPWNV